MEQKGRYLPIASGWMAGRPKSGQYRSSKGAINLAKSSCSSIRISRWLGSIKSLNRFEVNWKRVESLRQRSASPRASPPLANHGLHSILAQEPREPALIPALSTPPTFSLYSRENHHGVCQRSRGRRPIWKPGVHRTIPAIGIGIHLVV